MFREMYKLIKITGGGRRFALLLLLRSPVDLLFTLTQAHFLRRAFDAVGRADAAGLTGACLFFGVATLGVFLYNGTVWSIYAPFCVRMERRLCGKLFAKIASLSCRRVEASPGGDWLTRLNTDVQMPFSQPLHLPHAVNAILRLGVSAVVLWGIDPAAFGWVMLFAVPHVALSYVLCARAMSGLNKRALEATAENTGDLAALVTCADVAALYDGQAYLLRKFEKSSLRLLRSKMRMRRRNALSDALLPLFRLSGYLTLLLVSGRRIAGGGFTFGGFTEVSQYSLGVSMGAMMLVNCLISIQAGMAGIRRILETMDTEVSDG